MKKFISIIIVLGIITGVIFGIIRYHTHSQADKAVQAIQSSVQKQVTGATSPPDPGTPVTITIPKINVTAVVEAVGMDAQGRMDVPKTAADTAWYSPGYKPGMKGSAVIDGHLDRVTGAPAVFWNLKLLAPGDVIYIKENNGVTYTFAVDRSVRYPYNSFPIKEVFGTTQTPMLNLITCNGIWDKNTRNYSDRLVVYSKLVAQK